MKSKDELKPGKRMTARDKHYMRLGILFAAPWIIGFLCFTLLPMLTAVFYSFTNYNLFKKCDFVGINNFVAAFNDKYIWKSLYNTLYITLIGTPVTLLVALFLALVLNQKKAKGLPIYRTLFYLPSVVPIVASSMLFLWVLNGDYGLLNSFLNLFGIQGPYWLLDPAYTKISLIMMDSWRCGTAMIIFLAALRSVPESLYEAAELDGAGSVKRFLNITIPYISPTIQFQVVMAIIYHMQYFTQAYVFSSVSGSTNSNVGGGPGNSMLFYSLYLYRQAFVNMKMGYACALSIIMAVLIAVFIFLYLHISEKNTNYDVE